jgi:hypothetical protein
MKTSKDIAWTAGLLEGEGSFGILTRSPAISLQMTDKDTVEKFAHLVSRPLCGPYKTKGKDIWKVQFYGGHAVSWMMTIFVLMGSRRQQKIIECLNYWKAMPRKQYQLSRYATPQKTGNAF